MKKSFLSIVFACCFASIIAQPSDFVKGADVCSLSQQIDRGVKFHDKMGNERECLDLLKDYQMSAIRLRGWVKPKDQYCSKEDVLRQALHAKSLGMDVMIDFHCSNIPS